MYARRIQTSKCYTPEDLLDKYTEDMDYTDFANGEIRNDRQVMVYTSDSPKNSTCNYSGLRSTKTYTD